MDWSDDICFLCARMAPSICCLWLINKPINECRKLLFRTILTHIPQSLWFKNLPEISYLSSHYWRMLCEFSDLFSTTTYWRRHFSDSWKLCYGKQVCLFHQLLCVHCSTSTCFGLGGTRWTTNYFHNNTSSLFYWKIVHHSDIPPPTVPCAKNTGHIIYIV